MGPADDVCIEVSSPMQVKREWLLTLAASLTLMLPGVTQASTVSFAGDVMTFDGTEGVNGLSLTRGCLIRPGACLTISSTPLSLTPDPLSSLADRCSPIDANFMEYQPSGPIHETARSVEELHCHPALRGLPSVPNWSSGGGSGRTGTEMRALSAAGCIATIVIAIGGGCSDTKVLKNDNVVTFIADAARGKSLSDWELDASAGALATLAWHRRAAIEGFGAKLRNLPDWGCPAATDAKAVYERADQYSRTLDLYVKLTAQEQDDLVKRAEEGGATQQEVQDLLRDMAGLSPPQLIDIVDAVC